MASRARSQTGAGQLASGRTTAYWGLAFVVLLLVSAGMVTVPGERDGVVFVRNFYEDNRSVIVVAQLIGLAAAGVFLVFARGLQHRDWVGRAPWVFVCGSGVTVAAVLAGVPPLLLCMLARSGAADTISTLATASDLVDVVLFTAIAVFAMSVAVAVDRTWLRAVAAVVAVMSGVRAVILLAGGGALEVAGPMAFIVLILCLSFYSWSCERYTRRS
jgi:hypothetical protein